MLNNMNEVLKQLKERKSIRVFTDQEISKEAKDAIRKKNAEIVVFEFAQNTDDIWRELDKLRKLGVKCLVYFANDKTKYHFI